MRRWIVLALLCVLPLQFVWAAAAPYCAHEKAASKHFGHHPHEHQGAEKSASVDKAASLAMDDPDCVSCHLGASATLRVADLSVASVPEAAAPSLVPLHFESHTPPGPDRPNVCSSPSSRDSGGDVLVSCTLPS